MFLSSYFLFTEKRLKPENCAMSKDNKLKVKIEADDRYSGLNFKWIVYPQ